MSDYNRSTRECLVSQLHLEVRLAVQNYFQEHELGDMEAETLLCCETISEKKNAGGLTSWLSSDLDTIIHTGMLLTAQRFIWVRSGDKSGTFLSAANLENISVREYASLFIQDTGLEVSGYSENSKSRMRGYIAMGPEAAAQKFCDEVNQATIRLKPPVQSGWSKWTGQ